MQIGNLILLSLVLLLSKMYGRVDLCFITMWCALAATVTFLVPFAAAELSMPEVFGDNMVLQARDGCGTRSFFYGRGVPGETVEVAGFTRRSDNGEPYPAVVGDDGRWSIQADPCTTSNAVYRIAVRGSVSKNVLNFDNVVCGDVFVCSGQSNMVKPVSYAYNAAAILSKPLPNVRLFTVPEIKATTPATSFAGHCGSGGTDKGEETQQDGIIGTGAGGARFCAWQAATNVTLAPFSAVCYLTAHELVRLGGVPGNRPIGLVFAAVGGTSIQLWTPPGEPQRTANSCPGHLSRFEPLATQLFNGMIAPLVGYSLRAALWYQGEHDASTGRVDTYACRFRTLISSWRDLWGVGDFPFCYAQLAPDASGAALFPGLRLQQAQCRPSADGLVDTTGMAVLTDVGDLAGGVHPHNKTAVGHRLALQVMHTAYARQTLDGKQVPYDGFADGPILISVNRSSSSNSGSNGGARGIGPSSSTGSVIVRFNNAVGLALRGTHNCSSCCAAPGVFEACPPPAAAANNANVSCTALPASAITVNGTEVILRGVPVDAAAIRHAYQPFPQCVLKNSYGLVASSFWVNISTVTPAEQEATAAAAAAAVASVVLPPLPTSSSAAVAATPPMGFNSWNFYHCNIDEHAIKEVAQALIDRGMAAAGYTSVNIDDCWQVARDGQGRIVPDPVRFPSGLRSIADWLHARGLKFGIYTAAHGSTCQGRPGSYMHEAVDAATYCAAGIDYLKIDQCGGDSYEKHHLPKNLSWTKFQTGFRKCLAATGRPIVQSVESCGSVSGCGEWIANCANLWRTGADLEATWVSIMHNLDTTAPLYPLAGHDADGNGHWNDADMLQVGNVGITEEESRSHFAAWCFLASPLLVGTDVRTADNATVALLSTKGLIAVNQDMLGFAGRVVYDSEPGGGASESRRLQVYGKKLQNGDVAALFLNRGDALANITINFTDIWITQPGETRQATDLWTGNVLDAYTGYYTAKNVPAHGTAAIRFSATKLD